jgi:hypothetical protein
MQFATQARGCMQVSGGWRFGELFGRRPILFFLLDGDMFFVLVLKIALLPGEVSFLVPSDAWACLCSGRIWHVVGRAGGCVTLGAEQKHGMGL